MSGPVVGIDLGTTNTVVGIVQDGQAKAIADGAGDRLIPSVVSFHPGGNVLVGRQAKERRLLDASNTIYSVKRLIGRSWESEEVKRARSRFPFEMREGPGQAALVVARGETYTLPEISAFVLRKAKAIAEEALGATIERAVITVPANFNDLQRAATKVAGRVAGLEVLRILNEPTAAALAYGYGKGSTERIAIYDFGGGTFDVTLLDLSGNVFEVLATAGNTFLGGDDVDLAIAERMADAFLAKHRSDPRQDPQGFERLRAAAEQLKIDLSGQPRAAVSVEEVAHGPGGKSLNLDFSMTRREFDELTAPLVNQTFDVCREAMSVARLEPKDFDQILLVGGSTRMPIVKEQVERFFGRPVLEHISPDEVVAIGAAIQASALTGAERRRAEIPRPPLPAARTSQALALGQTMQIPPSSAARGSEPPPLPKRRTSPGIRPGAQTSPGVYSGGPAQGRPKTLPPGQRRGSQPPMVIQPPGGPAQEAVPHTADGPGATRRRQITGMGLGAPPQAQPPRTVGGLGPRGRMPTGSGLGGPEPRRVPTGAGLGPPPEPRKRMATGDYGTPGPAARARPSGDAGVPPARQRIPTGRGLGGEVGTLMSASDAAQSAKDAARDSTDDAWSAPLPLVGMADHNQDDLTLPVSDDVAARLKAGAAPPPLPKPAAARPLGGTIGLDAPAPAAPTPLGTTRVIEPIAAAAPAPAAPAPAAPAPAAAAAALGATALIPALVHSPSETDQMRAKYGNLPLIMPGDSAAKGMGKSTLPSSQMPELGALGDSALDPSDVADDEVELELPTAPADLQPAERGLGSTMLLDDAAPQFASAESRATAELRQYAAPTSTDEVTLVRHAVSVSPTGTFEFEDDLPIPDLPPSGEQTQVGRDPLSDTVKRQAPAGLGATMAMQGQGTGTALLDQQPNQPINFAETAKAIQSPLQGLPAQRPAMPTAMGLGAPGQPVIREMPGHPRPEAPAPALPGMASAPLLVDVTPLSLTVETVSGYCDKIINRNTPVPCEETRQFVTARDNQTVVRLRIGQGESGRFEDNTLLGELELAGLRPAARGQIAIAVTFSLDTDGLLNVSARDTHTGQATSAVVRLVGLDVGDVSAMQARHQAHVM